MKIGFDIEIPVINAKTNRLVLPYEEAGISRTNEKIKEDRKKRLFSSGEFDSIPAFIHTDGVMLEINPRPTTCRVHSHWTVLDCILGSKDILEKNLGIPVKLLPLPLVKLTKEIMTGRAREETLELGCQAEYNAYLPEGEEYKPRVNYKEYPYRGAGGHIHFEIPKFSKIHTGYNTLGNGTWKNVVFDHTLAHRMVKALDRTVGILSVALATYPRLEAIRRELYGHAGSYRMQPHGLEYRVLSNFYLIHPSIKALFHGLSRTVVSMYHYNNEPVRKLFDLPDATVRGIINTCNTVQARKIVRAYHSEFERLIGINMSVIDLMIKHKVTRVFPLEELSKAWNYGDVLRDHELYGWENGANPFYREAIKTMEAK